MSSLFGDTGCSSLALLLVTVKTRGTMMELSQRLSQRDRQQPSLRQEGKPSARSQK